MPSVEIPEIAKFEITADEIVTLSKAIFAHTKDAKVRKALRLMFRELYKANHELVDGVLEPLCSIASFEEFCRQFDEVRKTFIRTYFDPKKPLLAEINCHKVSSRLDDLKRSQAWKRRIPVMRRAVLHLELLSQGWIADDAALWRADRSMYDSLASFLDETAKLKAKNAKKAFKYFDAGIESLKGQYKSMTKRLANLDVLSERLR